MRLRVLTKLKVVILMIGMILGSRMGLGIVSVVGSASSINPQAGGIASKYPGDSGIAEDPDVVFADDFESWSDDGAKKPADKWHSIRTNKTSRTCVIPGKVIVSGKSGPGECVLEIACWHEKEKSQAGGLTLKLGNYNHPNEALGDGYNELYVRYYIKFDENYRAVRNHGSNLGGRDLTMENPAWVGMAGIRDVFMRGYFYSGVQPRGERGSQELEMGFYSYHLDKKGPWGDGYQTQKRIPIKVGTWHCVERHMRLNSVDPTEADGNADGMEELWIDGQWSIRREGLRFRRVPQLRSTYFSLETYYHGLPEEFSQDNPIRVYFDNVVIARKYIGTMK